MIPAADDVPPMIVPLTLRYRTGTSNERLSELRLAVDHPFQIVWSRSNGHRYSSGKDLWSRGLLTVVDCTRYRLVRYKVQTPSDPLLLPMG